MKDKLDVHGSASKVDVNSHKDSIGNLSCEEFIFSLKLLGFMSNSIKLLVTELVGQCSNILPLAFSAFFSQCTKVCICRTS